MANQKIIFRCTNCDSQYPKWQGRCRECGSWGTIEEVAQSTTLGSSKNTSKPAAVVRLSDKTATNSKRVPTGIHEVDRVLGGGFVPGGVYLLAGDPGIGKSTLLLQIVEAIHAPTLYVSGEESIDQIQGRIARIGGKLDHAGFLSETDIGTIGTTIDSERPVLVVIDSIQTMGVASLSQEPGSISQVKAVAASLVEVAKQSNVAMCIVSHVNKSGNVAGPKTLEHAVDCVLYIEGDEHHQHRILRATKNRFGSVSEIGVFTIGQSGFQEVKNPAKVFLDESSQVVAGSVVTPVVEGSRVFFVECQALTTKTHFGYPVRKSVGFDQNRLQMLLAVLQKRLGIPVDQFDVHVNVAGGMKMQEPSCDLAVVLAVLSAIRNTPVAHSLIAFGEVGLAGEVRSVPFTSKRAEEAKRVGFSRILCAQTKGEPVSDGMQAITSVKEAYDQIIGS
jgi:DNA repair protein RadA/Sms